MELVQFMTIKPTNQTPKQQIITLTFVVKHTSGGVRASGLTTNTP